MGPSSWGHYNKWDTLSPRDINMEGGLTGPHHQPHFFFSLLHTNFGYSLKCKKSQWEGLAKLFVEISANEARKLCKWKASCT